MSKNPELKSLEGILIIFFSSSFLILFLDYLFYNRIILSNPQTTIQESIFLSFYKLHQKLWLFKLVFLSAVSLFNYAVQSIKLTKETSQEKFKIYFYISIGSLIVFLIGFTDFYFWDLIVYPISIITCALFIPRVTNKLRENFKADISILGITTKLGKCPTVLKAFDEKGKPIDFVIPNSNYHSIIGGGTGAGKSVTLFKPIIYQKARDGYCGVIYDYNGDPKDEKDGSPVQTRTALRGLMDSKSEIEVKFGMINFTDLRKTHRVNILSPKYIRHKSDINFVCQTLMKNLNPEWKEKTDFWAQNAIAYVTAVMYMLYKNYSDKGYCTLPHVISACLYNHEAVLEWCNKDSEVRRISQPIFTAYKKNAEGQISGVISSSQLPLAVLDNREIFWVMSKDDLNLDITNPKAPSLLCLCNAPTLTPVITPVLSVIMITCMRMMNQPGRLKSIFMLDEFPTINVYKIDEFLAVVRKYYVEAFLGYQDDRQAKRDYGEDSARIIKNIVGNIIQGSTNNIETGKYISDMFGETKIVDYSYSENSDSLSVSEKLQREKVVQSRDVLGQPIGHFMGKVVGGDPAFFSLQFDYYKDEHLEPTVPNFAIDLKKSTGDPDLDYEIIKQMAAANYKRINDEVDALLFEFLPENAEKFNGNDNALEPTEIVDED